MKMVERLFARYGRGATLNGRPVRLFAKNARRSTQETYTPLGYIPQGQYTCYLPSGADPQAGDSLVLDGEGYELTDVQAMKLGDRDLYWRATARKKGGAEPWDM